MYKLSLNNLYVYVRIGINGISDFMYGIVDAMLLWILETTC